MKTGRQRLVAGGAMAALALAALWGLGGDRAAALAAEGDEVEYTFGRPVKDGEQTYDWYRKTHADWAAKRYGVDPNAVGDGMDTWHWWCGVDNPGFWRKMAMLTGKKANVLDRRGSTSCGCCTPCPRRAMGQDRSHQRPRLRARRQARPVRADDRSDEGRLADLGPRRLRLFQRRRRPATLHQQELRREEMVGDKYLDDASSVEPPYLVGMACVRAGSTT